MTTLFERLGDAAVDHHLIPASAMRGYGAVWDDTFAHMWPSIVIYLLLSVYWTAEAENKAEAVRSEPTWSTALHQVMVNAGVLLMIVPIPGLLGRILPNAIALTAGGWVLSALGAGFAILARRQLGRNWSSEVRVAERHELVRTGPYRYVRHPIYTGLLLMYVGFLLSSGRPNALIGLAVILLTYVRKIAREERLMHQTFGDAFEDYRRHSWIIFPPLI